MQVHVRGERTVCGKFSILQRGAGAERRTRVSATQGAIAQRHIVGRKLHPGGKRIPMNLLFGCTRGRWNRDLKVLRDHGPSHRRCGERSAKQTVEGRVAIHAQWQNARALQGSNNGVPLLEVRGRNGKTHIRRGGHRSGRLHPRSRRRKIELFQFQLIPRPAIRSMRASGERKLTRRPRGRGIDIHRKRDLRVLRRPLPASIDRAAGQSRGMGTAYGMRARLQRSSDLRHGQVAQTKMNHPRLDPGWFLLSALSGHAARRNDRNLLPFLARSVILRCLTRCGQSGQIRRAMQPVIHLSVPRVTSAQQPPLQLGEFNLLIGHRVIGGQARLLE